MNAPDLGELRALLEAATPGEWRADNGMVKHAPRHDGDKTSVAIARQVPDATLIAAAVNALAALLDDLEAARDQIAMLTAQRDRAERRHERLESGVEALAGEWVGTRGGKTASKVIQAHEPRWMGCRCGDAFGDSIDQRWHLVNRAVDEAGTQLRVLLAESAASEEGA